MFPACVDPEYAETGEHKHLPDHVGTSVPFARRLQCRSCTARTRCNGEILLAAVLHVPSRSVPEFPTEPPLADHRPISVHRDLSYEASSTVLSENLLAAESRSLFGCRAAEFSQAHDEEARSLSCRAIRLRTELWPLPFWSRATRARCRFRRRCCYRRGK